MTNDPQPLFVPPIQVGLSSLSNFTVTGAHTSGRFSMVEVSGWSEGMGSGLHTHTNEDEAWYVLEGELSFDVGPSKIVAAEGAFVMGPKGIQHTFRVARGPARFLLMYWPAGIEGLFIEREELRKRYGITYNAADGRNEPDDPEYWQAARALPKKYGIVNRYTTAESD